MNLNFRKKDAADSSIFLTRLYQEFEKKSFPSSGEITQEVLRNTIQLYKHGNIHTIDRIISELTLLKHALDESIIVAITDKSGIILFANKKFCEISKYSESELVGKNHRILKSGYHPHEFYKEMWTTISSGKRWEGEIKNRAKDGSFYWVETVILPIMDGKRNLQQYISFRTDITKQKELEEKLCNVIDKLSDTEQKYTMLFNNSPHMLFLIDSIGMMVDCNEACADLLKYSKQELIGRPFINYVAKCSFAEITGAFDDWKTKGNANDIQIFLERKDGEKIPTLLSVFTIVHDGRQTGCLIAKDLSEIKQAKEIIDDLKQKRLAVIGEIAGRISHDLRNPLSIIKNSIEFLELRSENKFDEMDCEEFSRIKRGISRMTHQINDVMDYVRVSSLNYNNHSLRDIINSVLERITIPQQIEITLSLCDTKIICDEDKLGIVLLNLIHNAIHAIGENNAGQINISHEVKERHHVIEIKDSGPGIPVEILPRIFDPLFTTKQKGTGLGLASCKNIIEQHGGNISVRINPTTFTIYLNNIT